MIPFDPAFPIEEFRARMERVRSGMAARRLDALLLLSPQNVFYLSGMDSPGVLHYQCLIVPLEADPVLVVFDFHDAAAENTCWIKNRVLYTSFDDPIRLTAEVLEKLRLRTARLGLEQRSPVVSAGVYGRLSAALSDAKIEDPFGIVEDVRLRKSPAEIAYIRRAAVLTDAAVEPAYQAMRAGARDTDVAAAILEALYRAGSDALVSGPIVAAGYRAGVAHHTFNGHTLVKGDTVFLEYTGCVRRYVAPVMRTGILGEPTPEMRRIAEAGARACLTLIETARPGVPCSEVAKAALAVLEPVLPGLVFHHDFGYPVGIHYPLSWNEQLGCMLRVDNPRPLEAGMVFHLPMSLRKRGEFGIGQSHTIVITETGAEPLTRSPHGLRVVEA